MAAARCESHPERKARYSCSVCGRRLCRACRLSGRERSYCSTACEQRSLAAQQAEAAPAAPHPGSPQPNGLAPSGAPSALERPGGGSGLRTLVGVSLLTQLVVIVVLLVLLVPRLRGERPGTDAAGPGPGGRVAASGERPGEAGEFGFTEPVELASPPTLALREGVTLRGSPVAFRGRAEHGDLVSLRSNGRVIGCAEVESDGRFEFSDVPLSVGSHVLDVVAYSDKGSARSQPVSVRYERP